MKGLYAAILIAVVSAVLVIPLCSDGSDAATDTTLECYIYDSTGSDFSYKGTVSATLYKLTDAGNATSLEGYDVLSKTVVISDATNIKKMTFSGIDATVRIDTSTTYICFDIGNYTVSTVQEKYFALENTKTVNDTENNRIFTLYNLNTDGIGKYFEYGRSYTIGNDSKLAAGVTFEYATGTITGKVLNSDGVQLLGAEVTVTDTERHTTVTAVTDTSGIYSLTFFTGEYTIKVNSNGYYDETRTTTFYDDKSYSASLNKQADIKFTTKGDYATILGYISNTNGKSFDAVTNIEINLYYLKGTEYELISSTKTIEKIIEDGDTYYRFTLSDVPYKSIDKCYLYINMTGYSVGLVQTSCLQSEPETLIISGIPHVSYKFNSTMFPSGYIEGGKTYSIGDKKMPGIQMKDAKGTITGKVTTDTSSPTALNGVQISLYDTKTNDIVASGLTSNNGSYSIICSTGYYKITASLNDYKTYTGYVTVYDDVYNPEMNIQPDIRLSTSESLFGTDLPHVLMAIGLVIAGILVLAVTVHRLLVFKKE